MDPRAKGKEVKVPSPVNKLSKQISDIPHSWLELNPSIRPSIHFFISAYAAVRIMKPIPAILGHI